MSGEDGFVGGGHPLEAVMAVSMQALLAASNEAVITLDSQDRIVMFNPAAERMFGVRAAEALGGSLSRFIPEDRREAHARFVEHYRRTGEASQRMGRSRPVSGLRASGEEFPVEAFISRAEIGGEIFLTVVMRDITERQLAEDARLQILLAREIEHRAKNALTAVQALLKVTSAETKEELIQVLKGRIAAFARGYSLLVMNAWKGVDLNELIKTELSAWAPASQLRIGGPRVRIAPEAVQPLSLVLHELATNALKYGALSQEGGLVEVGWKITPAALELTWRETGGPHLAGSPEDRGFGSVLLDELLVKQLKGSIAFDWREEGLVAVFTVPSAALLTKGDGAAADTDAR